MRWVWLNKLTATTDQPTEELFQAQMGNMGFFRVTPDSKTAAHRLPYKPYNPDDP
jgi:hypothetical protein